MLIRERERERERGGPCLQRRPFFEDCHILNEPMNYSSRERDH